MSRELSTPDPTADLVRGELRDKLAAVTGYDAIIWKIRAGYVAILYGALTLLAGQVQLLSTDDGRTLVLVLVCGFSSASFLVDLGFVIKKLRVIVAKDALVDKLRTGSFESVGPLLHMSGEMSPGELSGDVSKNYCEKLRFNLFLIVLPIYVTTPLIAIVWMLLRR